MRLFLALSAFVILSSCSTGKGNHLNGTWIPVEQEIGGTSLPMASFASQKLEIKNNEYTMTAESVDKGTSTVSGNKMDINGVEGPNAGKTFKAIYKMENDRLIICYNLAGDRYPERFSTAGEPMFFMATFKRAD